MFLRFYSQFFRSDDLLFFVRKVPVTQRGVIRSQRKTNVMICCSLRYSSMNTWEKSPESLDSNKLWESLINHTTRHFVQKIVWRLAKICTIRTDNCGEKLARKKRRVADMSTFAFRVSWTTSASSRFKANLTTIVGKRIGGCPMVFKLQAAFMSLAVIRWRYALRISRCGR